VTRRTLKILAGALALTGALSQSVAAQSAALPTGSIFKNARLAWEGRQLIFYATFNQDGHDLPLWLEWRTAKAEGHTQIDVIEQYGRGMPIAVTLISLEKNPAGRDVLYMGWPASNTPKLEGGGNLDASLETSDAAGRTDDYKFSLAPSGAEALPRLSVSR
jgi:hypothetical protein